MTSFVGSQGECSSKEMTGGVGTPMVMVLETSVNSLVRYLIIRVQCSAVCMRKIILQAEKGRTVIQPVEESRGGLSVKFGIWND